jgi:hypothetical protein
MTKYAVVTTFSPKGYELYGKRFIDTFASFWPADVPLYIYYEGEKPGDASNRAEWIPLEDDADRTIFLANNKDKPEKVWDYRYRIATYCHKVFAYTAAPRDSEWLIWLDSDIETFNPVTPELLHRCMPDGFVASYLGRPWFRHSETGFIAFRLDDDGNRFLDHIREFYTTGSIRRLLEWHDCAVFDFIRRLYERDEKRFCNLSAAAQGLKVFEQSALGEVMRHHKGPMAKSEIYGESL